MCASVWPKFNSIRSPVSNWSCSTTIRLISTHRAMIEASSGFKSSKEIWFFKVLKSVASLMQPYLITSPIPSLIYRVGNVFNTSGSIRTILGWKNAPTRFFPCGRSTATFPPTEESTWARREVGIWTSFTPRRKLEAANPARSPITPPPRAMTRSLLEIFASSIAE